MKAEITNEQLKAISEKLDTVAESNQSASDSEKLSYREGYQAAISEIRRLMA